MIVVYDMYMNVEKREAIKTEHDKDIRYNVATQSAD